MLEINKNINYADLQDAMELDIDKASEDELSAAEGILSKYVPSMAAQLKLIKSRRACILPVIYEQGTMVTSMFPDGSKSIALVEERKIQKVNAKAVKDAAGLQYSITGCADPEAAKYIDLRQVGKFQAMLKDYNNGQTSLGKFINETVEVQAKLFDFIDAAKEGGDINE